MPIFSASSRLTRKKVEDLHLLERSATLQFSPQRIPFCLRSCSISCWSLRASSPARTAKFSVLSAKMMPREELTINPQWSFMPYFATSSRLPPLGSDARYQQKVVGHNVTDATQHFCLGSSHNVHHVVAVTPFLRFTEHFFVEFFPLVFKELEVKSTFI